ncbi:MAG: hypothetical protein CMF52_04365 [Legionellales bacterium]|nr:hypothetical protein [Legionellales bacterium]
MQPTQSNSYRDTPPTTQEDYATLSEDHAGASDDGSIGEGSSNSSTISATSDALEPTAGDGSHLTASAAVGTVTQEYPMDDSDDSAESLVDVYSVDSSSDAGTQHMEEHQQLEQQSMQYLENGDHASASEQNASEQNASEQVELKRTVNTTDAVLQGSSISDKNLKDSSVVKADTDPLETDNSTFEASRDDLGEVADNSTTSLESAASEQIDTNHLATLASATVSYLGDNSQAARTDLEKILQGSSEAAVENGTASTNHENLDEIPEQETKVVVPDDGMNSSVSGAASDMIQPVGTDATSTKDETGASGDLLSTVEAELADSLFGLLRELPEFRAEADAEPTRYYLDLPNGKYPLPSSDSEDGKLATAEAYSELLALYYAEMRASDKAKSDVDFGALLKREQLLKAISASYVSIFKKYDTYLPALHLEYAGLDEATMMQKEYTAGRIPENPETTDHKIAYKESVQQTRNKLWNKDPRIKWSRPLSAKQQQKDQSVAVVHATESAKPLGQIEKPEAVDQRVEASDKTAMNRYGTGDLLVQARRLHQEVLTFNQRTEKNGVQKVCPEGNVFYQAVNRYLNCVQPYKDSSSRVLSECYWLSVLLYMYTNIYLLGASAPLILTNGSVIFALTVLAYCIFPERFGGLLYGISDLVKTPASLIFQYVGLPIFDGLNTLMQCSASFYKQAGSLLNAGLDALTTRLSVSDGDPAPHAVHSGDLCSDCRYHNHEVDKDSPQAGTWTRVLSNYLTFGG